MSKHRRQSWSRRDLILLFERLELYIIAGMSLSQALESARYGSKSRQADALIRIAERVDRGATLSRAFSETLLLPSAIIGLIQYGEDVGQLAKALGTCRALTERQDELFKKCLSSLTYPVVIGIFAALLTIGLVRGIMPQIIPLLLSLHVDLPILTRVVIFISEGLLKYGLYVGGAVTIIMLLCVYCYRKFEAMRYSTHFLIAHLPIIGSLVQAYALSVFLQTCGSLIESGLPVSDAFNKTALAVGFLPLRKRLAGGMHDINRGVSISQVLSSRLSSHLTVPDYLVSLFRAGEASGTLGTSILRGAAILDRDIEHSLKKLTALIEPLMMVGMGGVVGSIALSIMMPIYDISKVLQK